jgi:hypothetical protein
LLQLPKATGHVRADGIHHTGDDLTSSPIRVVLCDHPIDRGRHLLSKLSDAVYERVRWKAHRTGDRTPMTTGDRINPAFTADPHRE